MNFTSDQIQALRELTRLWPDRPFVLIGATALGCFLELPRATLDLDLSLSVSLDEYPAGLQHLPAWTRDRRIPHRWKHSGGIEVDVIPAGPTLLQRGKMTWPDGSEMNLTGFRLAFMHNEPFKVAPGVSCRVATVPVVALLKMAAYLDRPVERQRDLRDLAIVLDEYPITDEERFSDRVLDRDLRYEQVAAYFLGRRIAEMADRKELELARFFLGKLRDEDDVDGTQARMLAGTPSWQREPRELLLRLDALEAGLMG